MLRRLPALLAIAFLAFPPSDAEAQSISLVRDTEIENTIRVYCAPLFRAAGLDVSSVRIHLVNDKPLNAFVAGGLRIFVNTGLLTATDDPNQVIGVLAHEIGHIEGGHLARKKEDLRDATAQAILTTILGATAAAAAGRPDGIPHAIMGGATVGQRSALAYSRGMEQAADQAAIRYLEATGQSARGILNFLELLRKEEGLARGEFDPYMSSHPVTTDRIRFLRNYVANSRYSDAPPAPDLVTAHRRMRGKLIGFLEPPTSTLSRYREDADSIEAKYARAIAYMRLNDPKKSLAIIDPLIAASPNDPFFHELRGDILRDAGRQQEAIDAYRSAVAILPWAALIRVSLAQMQLALEKPSVLDDVVTNLKHAIRYEPRIPRAWRQLATAYGRKDELGLAQHALAEEAILRGDTMGAMHKARKAMRLLPKGSPDWLRAQDIELQAKQMKKREDKG
jgi:predicted Zn-dependent protease